MTATLLVIPTGNDYAIEKIEDGKVFALFRSKRGVGTEKVIIESRDAAEGVVRFLETDETSFFRNRPWFWSALSGVTQGGAGVDTLKGASA